MSADTCSESLPACRHLLHQKKRTEKPRGSAPGPLGTPAKAPRGACLWPDARTSSGTARMTSAVLKGFRKTSQKEKVANCTCARRSVALRPGRSSASRWHRRCLRKAQSCAHGTVMGPASPPPPPAPLSWPTMHTPMSRACCLSSVRAGSTSAANRSNLNMSRSHACEIGRERIHPRLCCNSRPLPNQPVKGLPCISQGGESRGSRRIRQTRAFGTGGYGLGKARRHTLIFSRCTRCLL